MAKQRQFDLIVFDWDGTLMDSTALIVRAIQAACSDMGLPVPDRESASYVIGLSLASSMAKVAPELDAMGRAKLAERYRYHFLAHDQELELFTGIRPLLEDLRSQDYLLAIATGKARAGLDRVLGSSGLRELFHATRCADESFSKPHPAMLLELMDALQVGPDRTLMVGDTTHDLLMAHNAGVVSVAMSYGAHSLEELQTQAPLAVLPSVVALQQWLIDNA